LISLQLISQFLEMQVDIPCTGIVVASVLRPGDFDHAPPRHRLHKGRVSLRRSADDTHLNASGHTPAVRQANRRPKFAAVLLDKAAELNDKVRFTPEHGRQSASTRRGAANVICDGFSMAEQEKTRPSRLGSLQQHNKGIHVPLSAARVASEHEVLSCALTTSRFCDGGDWKNCREQNPCRWLYFINT
jgi:hypothetical protein